MWLMIRVPCAEFKADIDRIARKKGFQTRSEYIRSLLRREIENEKNR